MSSTGPDPLYDQAVAIVREHENPSISLVQRELKIGYNRADRLLESMEADGIVGPLDSRGQRALLRRSHEGPCAQARAAVSRVEGETK